MPNNTPPAVEKANATRPITIKMCIRDSYIAIHDGARPLVNRETIEKTIFAAFDFDAAAPGIPVKDTRCV